LPGQHSYQGGSRKRRKRGRFSQASTRRPIVLYDQHQREWTAQVGVKTGMPTGKIVPNFRAPWYPDQQYFRVNPENTAELFIDYKAMLLRRNARMKAYHQGASEWARDKKIPTPEKLGEYSEQIRRGYGGPPKPLEPVVAAIQGNRYILGLTDKVDKRLERFVTKPRNEEVLAEYDFSEGGEDDGAKPETSRARAVPAARRRRDVEPIIQDGDDSAFDDFDGGAPGKAGEGDAGGEISVEELLAGIEDEAKADARQDLEDTVDSAARGGRRVPPRAADRAEKQAPRRPTASATRKGSGKKPTADAKKRQLAGRRSLADGAQPVIGE
jgi:hypothetical protein